MATKPMRNMNIIPFDTDSLASYYGSHQGARNRYNEDAWASWPEQRIYAVCDGMGGHDRGHQASRLAIHMLDQFIRMRVRCHMRELQAQIETINRTLYTLSYQQQLRKPMGSTLSLLCLGDNQVDILHVGDSRIYRWRNYVLTCLTSDDSPHSSDLAMAQQVPATSSCITQALGVKRQVYVRRYMHMLEPGDQYLLLTDGVSDVLAEFEIANVLERTTQRPAVIKQLLDMAGKKGGSDDKTILFVMTS